MAAVVHVTTTASTLNVATYATGSFTPTVDDLLVFMSAVGATVATGSASASANGITFGTEITHAVRGGIDTQYAYVAGQKMPSSPASMTCTMDVTGDNGTGAVDFVAALTGMSKVGSAAVRQAGANNGAAGTTPTVTLASACLTGNPVIAFMQNVSNPAGVTPPSSFTELADTGYTTPDKGAEYAHRDSGHTSATVTWGSTSATAWSAIVIEFDASAASVSGAGAAAFGGTFTALGIDRALGAAVAALGFTGAASGTVTTPGVTGAGAAAFGFTGAANGQPSTPGAATASFGFTGSAAGVPRTPGAGDASFGFNGAAAGQPRTFGVAVTTFGGSFAALGVDRALGVAVAAFGFTGDASGTVGNTPVTGSGDATFGFTGTADGKPTTFGVAVAAFGFTGSAVGVDRALGTALAALGFTGATAGLVSHPGLAVAAFGFTAQASGETGLDPAAPTPAERTYIVLAELRILYIPAEDRNLRVEPEPRAIYIPVDARTNNIEPEFRTVNT